MRFSQRVILTAVLGMGALASACDSSGIVSPQDIARLAQAQARWEGRPFADYSYEIQTFCFCPPEIGQWTRVSVRGGLVVAVEAVEPNPNFPITTLTYWRPIDALFADLHRAMTESSFGSNYSAIIVAYDAVLGYPTSIEYREKPNVADAGATISVRNVRALD